MDKRTGSFTVFALLGVLVLAASTVGTAFLPGSQAHAAAAAGTSIAPKPLFDPSFAQGRNAAQHAAVSNTVRASQAQQVTTLPFWSSVFAYNGTPGVTYPYQMVGTNPTNGGTTHVRTVLVPINVTFHTSGHTYRAHPVVAPTVNSPIFQNAHFYSGYTQYGDAYMRAQFAKIEKSDYHVLLDQPTVLPVVNWTVPAADGVELTNSKGVVFGDVDINWWDANVQNLMLNQLHLSARVFPMFLTNNIVLYLNGNPQDCCVIGYHNDVPVQASNGQTTSINVYAWSSYTEGIFPPADGIVDIDALSHEVGETLDDPFTDNIVPNWTVPSAPQYGCSNSLEVGDPLVGSAFTVNGYHPQDLVFFSWFARQVPSIGHNGWYTFRNAFGPNTTTC